MKFLILLIFVQSTGIKEANALSIPFVRKKINVANSCQANFVELIAGKTSLSAFDESNLSLWSEYFDPEEFYLAFKKSTKSNLDDYLESLFKIVHKDEQYASNLIDLLNYLKRKNKLSIKQFNQIISKKNYPYFKFSYDHKAKNFVSSFVIDEKKASLIKSFMKSQELGATYRKTYEQVLRKSNFSEKQIQIAIDHGLTLRGDKESLAIFADYIQFLERYNGNILSRGKLNLGLKNLENIYTSSFDKKWYDLSRWYKPHRQYKIDKVTLTGRDKSISKVLDATDLPAEIRLEYQKVIFESKMSDEQIGKLLEHAQFYDDAAKLEKFKEYIAYLDNLPSYKVSKTLKNVNKIYQYSDEYRFYVPDSVLPPHKQFIAQRNAVKKYEKKQYEKHLKELTDEHNKDIINEISFWEGRRKAGKSVDEIELAKLYEKLDKKNIPDNLKLKAKARANAESRIFNKVKSGCNGGKGSAKLQAAKKKFKRFKLALAIGGTPLFYLNKNWDKKDEDPFFWEKLGQEMLVGIMFTTIANKIITNTDKGFWGRYLEAYTKFAAIDLLNAGSYDALFGSQSYMRYFQQIYSGKELQPSDVEKEFERIKNSPNFDEEYEKLLAYLDEMSEKKNFKNLLDKHFHLGAYNSLEDNERITQEDLETEEAQDMMLELIAEKMYLSNMGNWEAFQTGNKGMDRWSFYRARNAVWDIKGMALNIAMFEIMCRQPMGKVGSWGLVMALAVGDWMYSGKITYNMRRDAINQ